MRPYPGVKPLPARHRLAPLLCLALTAGAAQSREAARTDDRAACDTAAAAASARTGVPLAILRSITRAETGRAPDGRPGSPAEPWPWTVQSGGRGHWFASRDAAAAHAAALLEGGETNVDVGCFQLNIHWHGGAFASLDQMLDPQANADHAAAFLAELQREFGDWRTAAGAYHSRDPDRAEAYVRRLETLHAATGPAPAPAEPPRPQPPARFSLVGAAAPLIGAARSPLVGGP
jgi:hypothetical protein